MYRLITIRREGTLKDDFILNSESQRSANCGSSNVNKPVYFRLPNLRYGGLTLSRAVN